MFTVGSIIASRFLAYYREDHTEVIDIEYDPELVSYTYLLSLFWNNHEYGLTTKVRRQVSFFIYLYIYIYSRNSLHNFYNLDSIDSLDIISIESTLIIKY